LEHSTLVAADKTTVMGWIWKKKLSAIFTNLSLNNYESEKT
jgi:hypothetical protein